MNVAGEGLDQFVEDGKLNLNEWTKEVKRRAREVATVEDFKVDVFPKLSPQAQEEFAKLPAETQAQIAEAYKKGSKGDRKKIEATLEAQVKVSPTDTHVDPVNIPTKVDTSAAAAQAEAAAAAAQRKADETGNVIELKTKIDRDALQRQVDRAAASITPPTITVKTKVQKDVP